MRKVYLLCSLFFISLVSWSQVYTSNFGTATSGTPASPFTAGESVSSNLTSAGWTGGNALLTGVNGGAYCITTGNGNGSFTLSLTVNAGYELDVTGTIMAMRRTSTGPTVVAMTINGTPAPVTGSPANGSFALVSTSTAVNNLTGSFTIVITTSGGTGTSQNVRLDDFVLNGTLTPVGGAGTSTITAGAGAEPATISSLVNTQGASSLNFDFTVTDDGATPATDAVATQISQIVLTAGTGNAVTNWNTAIAGVELSDGTNSTTTATITANTITFAALPNAVGELGHVADDAAKTYTLRLWLNTNMGALATTIDQKDFVFRVTEGNFTSTGSTFATGQDVNSGDGNNTVAVVASGLAYVQQPSNASTGIGMSPAVSVAAIDANGNRDLDFVSNIDITSTGTLTGSPVSVAAVAGIAVFSGLTHSAAGSSLILNAERNGTNDWDVVSNTFNILDPILPGEILINQFSPDYNGASDEYVEIVNTTNKTLDLSTIVLRYSSSGGSGPSTLATLSGTLQPHSFWLLSPNATITVGQTTALARDGSFTAGMAGTAGQIALVRTGDNAIIDGVGYGTITVPVFTEGTAAATPTTDGGLRRIVSGVDAGDNSTDFTTVANASIDLRNSSSRLANAGAAITGNTYSRLYVTGNSSIVGAVTLTERLVFEADGILTINNFNLNVTNTTTTNAVTGHSPTRYVHTSAGGSLIRSVATTGAYQFPVGTLTELQLATIDFTVVPTAGTLAVRFGEGVPLNKDITPVLTEGGHTLNTVSAKGLWEILASPAITETYNATFEARAFYDIMVASSLHMVKRANSGSAWSLDGTHVTTTGDATLATFSRTGMSGFSQFAPGGEFNVTLPASLLTFSGYKQGNVNKLQWMTASEQDNLGFEVQRSTDGVAFTVISFVNSNAPNGNSSSEISYSFTDNSPAGAKQYYRLRQRDMNGMSKLSNIVVIKGERPASLTIDGLFPNPSTAIVNVLVAAPVRDKVTVQILDATGRMVSQRVVNVETGSNTIPVSVDNLTAGTYLLKLVCSNNCEAVTSRFVKQ